MSEFQTFTVPHSSLPQHSPFLTKLLGDCRVLFLKSRTSFFYFGGLTRGRSWEFSSWGGGSAGGMGPRHPGPRAPPLRLNCLVLLLAAPLRVAGRSEKSSFPDKLGVSAAKTLLLYATNPLLPRESDCTTNGPLDLSSPYGPGAQAGGSTGVKSRPGELCCPLSGGRAVSHPQSEIWEPSPSCVKAGDWAGSFQFVPVMALT